MQVRFGASGVVVLAVVAACLVAVPARADTPSQPVTGGFVPVASTRLVDTRSGTGVEKRQIPGRQSITFGGLTDIEAARPAALLVNVTVTGAFGNGWVTAYPGGTARPATSTLNYRPGRAIANSAVVGLGTGGTVALYNGGPQPIDVVVDLNGYYLGGGSLALLGSVRPVAPTRLLDTRNSQVPTVAAGETVSVQIDRRGPFPQDHVTGAVLNVTATGASATGSITAGVNNTGAVPATSTLNYTPGVDVAAMAVAPVNFDNVRYISVRNNGPGRTRIVIDLEAYVVGNPEDRLTTTSMPPGSTVARVTDDMTGSPVLPLRALDTRNGTGTTRAAQVPSHGSVAVQLAGNRVVPTGAAAAVVTLTATRATATGHLALYRGSTPPPTTSSVNYVAGVNVANTTVVPLDAYGYAQVYNGGSRAVDVVADVTGFVSGEPAVASLQTRQAEPADMVVDDVGRRVYVSLPGIDSLDVYSADGRLLETIPHMSGPEGLLMHDGVLYIANRERGTVDTLGPTSGSRLRTVAQVPDVRQLAWAGGRLWATAGDSYDGARPYRLWSIASNGTAVSHAPPPGYPLGEEIASSPVDPSMIFVGARNNGYGVSSFEVSGAVPVAVAQGRVPGPGVQDMAVSPDGRVLTVTTNITAYNMDTSTLALTESALLVLEASAVAYSATASRLAIGRGGYLNTSSGPNAVVAGLGSATRQLSIGGATDLWTPPHGVGFDATGEVLYVLSTPGLQGRLPSYLLSAYDLTLPSD